VLLVLPRKAGLVVGIGRRLRRLEHAQQLKAPLQQSVGDLKPRTPAGPWKRKVGNNCAEPYFLRVPFPKPLRDQNPRTTTAAVTVRRHDETASKHTCSYLWVEREGVDKPAEHGHRA